MDVLTSVFVLFNSFAFVLVSIMSSFFPFFDGDVVDEREVCREMSFALDFLFLVVEELVDDVVILSLFCRIVFDLSFNGD